MFSSSRFVIVLCFVSVFVGAAPPDREVQAESPAMVFSRVSNSVVLIRAETPRGTVQGSGVIVGKGQVVTNLHVISGATKIVVSLKGKEAIATVSATSAQARDLAVLAVDALEGARVTVRASTDLVVGERVFAVGNPRGYEQSLTEGLVSALRKEGDAFVIQTSAAISPGSSGGGLFDTRGRLIGITTKTRTDGQSLNFAHPVEWVTALLNGGGQGDGGVFTPPFSVMDRPEALLCKLTEEARWGIFSEGTVLLESSSTNGTALITSLNTTVPNLAMNASLSSTNLVLKDLSRKTQVALFGGGRHDGVLFVSFEENGDVRATQAWVVTERGEARLMTHSGLCSTGTNTELQERVRDTLAAQQAKESQTCDLQPEPCYALALQSEGGERFLYFKKACQLGHLSACDEAISLAREVGDSASVKLLEKARKTAKPMAVPTTPAVAPAPPTHRARAPLNVK